MARFEIRPYQAADLTTLYRICLLTGDQGLDASAQYSDPQLIGHVYAGPYAVLEPDSCYVLTQDGQVVGYVIGAPDSARFHARCEESWFPSLRRRYPMPAEQDRSAEAQMIRALHRGHPPLPDTAGYPAHVHIDLLPEAQGLGWGRRLMQTLLDDFTRRSVPGVHLGVSAGNQRGLAFYRQTGWRRLSLQDWGEVLGQRLPVVSHT
ncbi:ribosomal protein S18 acetylase RimI-like enzyme [Chitinivorax tropicus]|uniref:Ribosomal protein S18 acetylase RimI-like enzyme n=1 Tax=Chitinivorax tropicus TaxID=714531 RepID=A0A840MWV8_9PROT|nr:GNAT family N-acetyltransferase [Chitinivorax tropicus]MBB5019651.1 ribosomal protein S18 acetylase RimI-like enzyme [Chitinivorax tropicus]